MSQSLERQRGLTRARPLGHPAVSLAAFAAGVGATAAIGSRQSRPGLWYRSLRKPPYQPPTWVFGPVWTVLYGLIAVSGWRVWRSPPGPARRRALGAWGAQLGLNAAWTWLFFGRRRIRAALVDVALLDGAIWAYRRSARQVDRTAARLVTPYLAWTAFATLLNAAIVRRNPGRA